MVSGVRIYVEGGGDAESGKRKLREGFHGFLDELVQKARTRRLTFKIVMCGGRAVAFKMFCDAMQRHPDEYCFLLVDAEGPVTATPWAHLAARDQWTGHGASDDQCHLMVQVTESWLLADPDVLAEWYGQGFQRSALPMQQDVEAIAKDAVSAALDAATRRTKKGVYHKIDHAMEILKRVSAQKVRTRARHCERLFVTIRQVIESSGAANES